MFKFKLFALVLLVLAFISPPAYSQENAENRDIQTISATVESVDYVGSSIHVKTGNNEVTLFVTDDAVIVKGNENIELQELGDSDPVTVKYYTSSEGKNIVISIADNNPPAALKCFISKKISINMKIRKIFTILAISLMALTGNNLAPGEANVLDYTGESIRYILKPGGKVEYNNFGIVDLKGVKANLITLKSKILFFEITEKIFSDPESLLPYKTERVTSGFWSKEYRTEEYDQKKFTVSIKRVKGEKLVGEQVIHADGPIRNVNLVLFYLCKQPDLKIGRHFAVKVLDGFKLSEFDLKLFSIDEITVPAGKFQTYHFKSTPDKYEIWISKDAPQVPIKIVLKSIVNYTMAMEKYNAR